MSKPLSRRASILATAVELFNERGLENVGIRDVASALSLSPGNVSYYFGRKEDLVLAVASLLGESNDRTFGDLPSPATVDEFLEQFRTALHSQYRFRCLLLSMVHVLTTYPSVRAAYAANQRRRRQMLRASVTGLVDHGCLETLSERSVEHLVSTATMIGRFWLSDWSADGRHGSVDDAVDRYVGLLGDALAPWMR